MGTCWGLLPNEAGCSPRGKLWALSHFGYLGMSRGGGVGGSGRGEHRSGPTGLGWTDRPGPTAASTDADQVVQINC